ncbi:MULTISPECIES: hypothetical protein [Streptomyces]|uniref:Secreted protein n=1 Tax=Streptomyces morookaense TaxID=1970 RepID=A0A7Y7BBK7_STRMO|nr:MULTISPECIES: hypothetical protein [Streptomyces]MCC2273843.1 hypothetical protein [Streptomyces sp. ET3-23]NVK82480.1 hypothetical protein [Streptomyces morookaense]GHF34006.1 hypothetical protein GCM10010359_40580 [Streptomyces morookaense]
MTFLRNAAVAAAAVITAVAGPAAPAGADPAHHTAEAHAVSVDGQSKNSTAEMAPAAQKPQIQPASSSADRDAAAKCWSGRTDGGRKFFKTCNGTSYRVYVDCTDGRYLFPETFSGQWEFRLTCPEGTHADWGGNW